MGLFLDAIKDIGIFMIICQTVLHFLPSGSTGGAFIKYGKPIAGLMVMLKICGLLLGKDVNLQNYMNDAIVSYEEKWNHFMDNMENRVDIPEIMGENEKYNQNLINKEEEKGGISTDIQINIDDIVIG